MVFPTRWSGSAVAAAASGLLLPPRSTAAAQRRAAHLLLIAALLLGEALPRSGGLHVGPGGQERRLLGTSSQLGEPIRIGLLHSACLSRSVIARRLARSSRWGNPRGSSNLCSTFSTPRGAYNQVMDDNCWYVCEAGDTLTDDQRAFLERVATGAFAWLASAGGGSACRGAHTLADLGACDDDQHVRLPSDLVRRGAADADLFLVVSVRPQRGGQPATPAFEDIARKERLLDRLLLHEVAHVLGFRTAALRAMGQEAALGLGERQPLWAGGDGGHGAAGGPLAVRRARPGSGAAGGAAAGGANGSMPPDELHWAADWGMGELMAGEVSLHSAFSALSLAFLEDTG
eukprot:jgi/Tetstr1/435954/TSEL_024835.t1